MAAGALGGGELLADRLPLRERLELESAPLTPSRDHG